MKNVFLQKKHVFQISKATNRRKKKIKAATENHKMYPELYLTVKTIRFPACERWTKVAVHVTDWMVFHSITSENLAQVQSVGFCMASHSCYYVWGRATRSVLSERMCSWVRIMMACHFKELAVTATSAQKSPSFIFPHTFKKEVHSNDTLACLRRHVSVSNIENLFLYLWIN